MSSPVKSKPPLLRKKCIQKENNEHRQAMEVYKKRLIESMPGKFIKDVKGDGCCFAQACFAWLFYHNKIQIFGGFIQKVIRELIKNYDAYAPLCGQKSSTRGYDESSLPELLWQLKHYFVLGNHKVPFTDALPLIISTAMSTNITIYNISTNGHISVQSVSPLEVSHITTTIELVGSTQPDHIDVILDECFRIQCPKAPLEYLTNIDLVDSYFEKEGFGDDGKPLQKTVAINSSTCSTSREEVLSRTPGNLVTGLDTPICFPEEILKKLSASQNEESPKVSRCVRQKNFCSGPTTPPGSPPDSPIPSLAPTPVGSEWSGSPERDDIIDISDQGSDTDVYIPDEERIKNKTARKRKLRVALGKKKKNLNKKSLKKRKLDIPSASKSNKAAANAPSVKLPAAEALPARNRTGEAPVKIKGSRVTMVGGVRPISELSYVKSRQGQQSINFEGYRFLNHRQPLRRSRNVVYRCGSFKATKCHSRIHVQEGGKTFFVTNNHNHDPVMKLEGKEMSTQTDSTEAEALGTSAQRTTPGQNKLVQTENVGMTSVTVQTKKIADPRHDGLTSQSFTKHGAMDQSKESQTDEAEKKCVAVQTEKVEVSGKVAAVQTSSKDLIEADSPLDEPVGLTVAKEILDTPHSPSRSAWKVSTWNSANELHVFSSDEFSTDSMDFSICGVTDSTDVGQSSTLSLDQHESNGATEASDQNSLGIADQRNVLVDVKLEVPEADLYDGIFFGSQNMPNVVELNGHTWSHVKGFKGACAVCHKKSKRNQKYRCSKCNLVFDEKCWTVYHSPRYSVSSLGDAT